jgi:hypothetical protein
MTTIQPVQLRRDPATGRPVVFYRNWRKGRPADYWTEGFSNGAHFECSDAWRLKCSPIDPADIPADALATVRAFETAGPSWVHCQARPVARLQRPGARLQRPGVDPHA